MPFMVIYSLINKKKTILIFSLFSLVMMYLLNGALKSIYFGLISCLFFYKGTYKQKNNRFLKTIATLNILSLLELKLTKSYLIADYMRRIFLIPAKLFQVYYDYFKSDPTYFLHSRVSKIFNINQYEGSLSMFISDFMGLEGSNANVGIFAEGFLSFGTLGVIIAAVIFILIISYLNRRRLSPVYFGILFSYMYIINTSFLETLFITHGLLFYLIFVKIIIPKENLNDKINQEFAVVTNLPD